MYCSRCGAVTDYEKTRIIQNVEALEIHYYAKCSRCGEDLGEKEIYHHTHWEGLTLYELKEIKKWEGNKND
jgi:hypothetical protein